MIDWWPAPDHSTFASPRIVLCETCGSEGTVHYGSGYDGDWS